MQVQEKNWSSWSHAPGSWRHPMSLTRILTKNAHNEISVQYRKYAWTTFHSTGEKKSKKLFHLFGLFRHFCFFCKNQKKIKKITKFCELVSCLGYYSVNSSSSHDRHMHLTWSHTIPYRFLHPTVFLESILWSIIQSEMPYITIRDKYYHWLIFKKRRII